MLHSLLKNSASYQGIALAMPNSASYQGRVPHPCAGYAQGWDSTKAASVGLVSLLLSPARRDRLSYN
jgi:hypothetical protein